MLVPCVVGSIKLILFYFLKCRLLDRAASPSNSKHEIHFAYVHTTHIPLNYQLKCTFRKSFIVQRSLSPHLSSPPSVICDTFSLFPLHGWEYECVSREYILSSLFRTNKKKIFSFEFAFATNSVDAFLFVFTFHYLVGAFIPPLRCRNGKKAPLMEYELFETVYINDLIIIMAVLP